MEEEEAGEAELADRRQLLVEAALGLGAVGRAGVALGQPRLADPGQLAVGGGVLGARVAVAELLGQVEAQPLGQAQGLGDRLGVLGEARRHRPRRGQGRARVAAPLRLARLQRRPQPHRDEGVLQVGAAAGVGVDVAGRDAGDAEPLGEAGEPAVAGAVAAPVGALQLDPEAVAAEGGEQPARQSRGTCRPPPLPGAAPPPRRGRSRRGRPAPRRAPRAAPSVTRRLPGVRARVVAGVSVGGGQQPTEVAVAGRVFDQEGEVGKRGLVLAPLRGHRHLRPGDRPHPEPPAGLGELHRAPESVVVGEGEGRVAALGRGGGQLHRRRGAVEEGEGRVSVQLYVWSGAHRQPRQARCRYQRPLLLRKTTVLVPSARTSSK